ncbi:hypothetical protein EDB83DRAFT_2449886 [Lactarius deliciosus]|nr:hypothetical protein EDB83DRAFT_2449886 [Lactarius deliciosus]
MAASGPRKELRTTQEPPFGPSLGRGLTPQEVLPAIKDKLLSRLLEPSTQGLSVLILPKSIPNTHLVDDKRHKLELTRNECLTSDDRYCIPIWGWHRVHLYSERSGSGMHIFWRFVAVPTGPTPVMEHHRSRSFGSSPLYFNHLHISSGHQSISQALRRQTDKLEREKLGGFLSESAKECASTHQGQSHDRSVRSSSSFVPCVCCMTTVSDHFAPQRP